MDDHIPRNGARPDKEMEARQTPSAQLIKRKKPDPERMRILRSLPVEVKLSLTREEADAFLYEEVWPDTLLHKLKDFLVEETKH